jgi:K(+)-stimulated pyrophosphate-energized sodium pump
MDMLLIAPISAVVSLAVAVYLYFYVKGKDAGTPKMKEISEAIKIGANAYLKRQNTTLGIFVVIVAVILGLAFHSIHIGIAYVFGAFVTTIASFFGMNAAVRANVRAANAAKKGLNAAFPVAFYGGAVMGLSIVGMALLGVSILFYIYGPEKLDIILGFSFGASSLALFAKAGGGIFTKTADIGADLVGKVELGIPEDDPRNPAVIADNVGDNVGDVAGMGADLTDSYIAGVIAAMIIGATIGPMYVIIPLLIKGAGIIASVIGMAFTRVGKRGNPGASLNRGSWATCVIFAIVLFIIIRVLHVEGGLAIFLVAVFGLIVGIIIGMTTDFFTSIDRTPVKRTAESAKTGAATVILSGFSYGILSIIFPIVGIAIATVASWYISQAFGLNPIYGIAIAAIGILSTLGMIISADAYGPIVDNARGITEQAHLGDEVLEVTDRLDAAGNTAKAMSKGFAIGAAALQVIALFAAYAAIVKVQTFNLMSPQMIAGLFLGSMMPPVISALLILGVGRNAFRMIEEVRRQFKEIPGLLSGEAKPDYARCVDIATTGALRELILPGVLSIVVPLTVGFILGVQALGGFLAGSIFSGIIFALLMSNGGGMWDNAKKFIEAGAFGGKGSDAHKAAVIGDTVGDPFKDTAGPTINTMITVMALISSLFAPLILRFALMG